MTAKNTRDEIRSRILGIKARTKVLEVAGVEIELRQPKVEDIVAQDGDVSRNKIVVKMLVDYCFVPGTDERVFEAEDAEAILAIPFGKDWQALNNAINELSDLGAVMAAEKGNSEATPAA